MSQFDNTPVTPPSSGTPGPAGWLPVWIKAVTRPNEQTFIDISESPEAQPKTAYLWIFLAGTLTYLVSGILQAIIVGLGIGTQDGAGAVFGGSLIGAICISPIAGAISVLFFALGVAVMQWIAKLFGGTGTYDKLVYAVGAIYVPISLVSMFLIPFYAIPFLNICVGIFGIGISLYNLFLVTAAIKGVNRFGWGQAIGSMLIVPGSLFLCSCLVIVVLMLMGPMIGNVFSGINQSLSVP
jgi:hypothetical protein